MAGAALDHFDIRGLAVGAGISRSISAALGPMFCALAWQARCSVTPPGSGFRSGRQPFVPRDIRRRTG